MDHLFQLTAQRKDFIGIAQYQPSGFGEFEIAPGGGVDDHGIFASLGGQSLVDLLADFRAREVLDACRSMFDFDRAHA